MSTVATDVQKAVEDAAAYLYVWALKDIPQDLRDAIREARRRETSTPGQRVLDTIIRNVDIADDQKTLVCQDTGIAVYYCRVGEHFPLHPAPRLRGLQLTGVRQRVAEILRDVLERPDVEVRRGVLDNLPEVDCGGRRHPFAFSAAAVPALRPKTVH